MSKRRALGVLSCDRREIDVSRAVLLMPHVPLFLEDAEERADGGVAGRFRQGVLNLGGRRLALLIEDVQDLPLASAKVLMGCRVHTAC
jgi:hypothetical protein